MDLGKYFGYELCFEFPMSSFELCFELTMSHEL